MKMTTLNASTLNASTDSRVLGWGALTVAVLVVAAFLSAARPSPGVSLSNGSTGVTTAHVLRTVPGRG
jgi:hypothetical protein